MIGRLLGHVVTETPEGALIIDVAGVGYEVLAPVGTVGRAAKDDDGRVTLFVHTTFRQDSLDLFAFASEHERRVFRRLIAVPNVGPRRPSHYWRRYRLPNWQRWFAMAPWRDWVGCPALAKKPPSGCSWS